MEKRRFYDTLTSNNDITLEKFTALPLFTNNIIKMSTEAEINVRNSLWRRVSKNVSLENVSSLAGVVRKAFARLVVCGKEDTTNTECEEEVYSNTPIYTGPKIQVPWKGEEFKYPGDRFLTNAEICAQLNILELRFRTQTQILEERKQKSVNGKLLVKFTFIPKITILFSFAHARMHTRAAAHVQMGLKYVN